MKFERKVKNPELAGKIVFAWVVGEIPDEELLTELAKQGLLTESEAEKAYAEVKSYEQDIIQVFFDDDCVEVNARGEFTVYDVEYDENQEPRLLGGA